MKCLVFNVDCGTLAKGIGVAVMAITLFIGSVYLILTAVLGRWLGYLVLMVSLSGWMILFSALWFFGFWSQGLETPTNLGPRGSEPAWIVLQGGLTAAGATYQTFEAYPGKPWAAPTEEQSADEQSVTGTAQTFLADQANSELGIEETDPTAVTTTQFTVDSIRFATDGNTPLAVVQAHFANGGPLLTLSMYHDGGSVPRYSLMFMAGSILLFVIHLPLLDRAEKKRKEFLTGGSAPPWYGPA
jgi:hypothetical protein